MGYNRMEIVPSVVDNLTYTRVSMPSSIHVPVMPDEILRFGNPCEGQIWVDGTGGGGGHSRLLRDAVGITGRLVILDRDPAAAQHLEQLFANQASVHAASYDELPNILRELNIKSVDGILLDLGLSSDQLADGQRGFSFQFDGELDMRFDPTVGIPAWQWLARVDERTLADTIYQLGEERFSRRIAKRIVESRKSHPIRSVEQLRELIYAVVPSGRRTSHGRKHGRVDPATRTFQALRIFVNRELEKLQNALQVLPDCLAPGGRLLIISFHSLEDRPVKCAFRDDPRLEVITRKPIRPSEHEIAENPRARSAKLRVAERIRMGVAAFD